MERNRGAAGWGFEPLQKGRMFIPTLHDINNAPWPYDGEIDNGFIGAMRTSCSVFYRDDVLDMFSLAGTPKRMEREDIVSILRTASDSDSISEQTADCPSLQRDFV